MASKRGLNAEEKRKRMLDWFFESQDFYQLKDVEKLCSAEKGITLNTIKDTLTSLVDDGLVDSEKIGTSVYYWALPSKAINVRKENIKKFESELKTEKEKNEVLKQRVESIRSSQDQPEKRAELIEMQEKLKMMKKNLQSELAAYKENDPEIVKTHRNDIKLAKAACNRWIDNIFTLKSWFKKKYNLDNATLEKQFEIPSELDYIA